MKIETYFTLMLMGILLLVGTMFYYLENKEVIIPELECNQDQILTKLNDLNKLNSIEKDISNVESKLNVINLFTESTSNKVQSLVINTIKFYPRTQRKCRNPIEVLIDGISMQDLFFDGDILYMDKVNFKDVELGDVIFYDTDDNSIIHAVVGKYSTHLITAGYNNERLDDPVMPDQVKYRYCFK